mmetsp:Transcript_24348/g.56393  ORF Transcript_24348/g.56393 Transcript_24348/m.56393 type:complete len:97 (+) Transcript_24348:16-306(+)|eukprot:CAMPEP_0114565408 /NCGR_PEP_ID=MMETSP0114-20121206/14290_1 /TAXON_ID=31324 /ORGANISM="Goniomonas sp, Strain m" /LENGTH=96 /DNA_ID=CAMNT_0001751645 /DNA_START=14 /DNA_END=304 /DNA_ORIENTATION=-
MSAPSLKQTSDDLKKLWSNPDSKVVLQKLIVATIIMFSFPFMVYFACTEVLFSGYEESTRLSIGGFAAVCAVNVVIFGYVVMAFREDQPPTVAKRE